MAKILDWNNLLRVRQWYKNLLVFLAIFFVGHLFNTYELYLTILGFISLSLISSTNYIINDLIDLKRDRLHPEKKLRPLASGKIKKPFAIILAVITFLIGISLSLYIGLSFFYLILVMIILTQLYSLFLKHIIFADILTLSVLFVIRAISGAVIINVKISPWLILCPFFLSLFLASGKRHADLLLLKNNAASTRKVLQEYNHHLTNHLMVISTTLFIFSYSLYSFLSEHQNLLYTLPFALFVIFRYFYLINQGSLIARHPEKSLKDFPLLISLILWIIILVYLIYI